MTSSTFDIFFFASQSREHSNFQTFSQSNIQQFFVTKKSLCKFLVVGEGSKVHQEPRYQDGTPSCRK